jgi:hypothetical protein
VVYAYCEELETAEHTRDALLKSGGEAIVVELPLEYMVIV